MATFINGDGIQNQPSSAAQTDMLQALVRQSINERLPLLLRGQITLNKTIFIKGGAASDPAGTTAFGNLHIDGGTPGETTLFFDASFTGNTMFVTDRFLRASEYLKFNGIKFASPATHNDRSAIHLPNASFLDVEISNCWFYHCGVHIKLAVGYYGRTGEAYPINISENPIQNMTRVTGNRFTSEDSGIDISPIIFRNGNYRSLVNEDPPAEPRSDRQSGFYFHSNHFDVFMTNSDNTNIATLGYGLTQGMRIIGNTFKQRNRAAFADVDLALGAHRATFTNNLM